MILRNDPNQTVLEAIERTPPEALRSVLRSVTTPRRFPFFPCGPADLLEMIKAVDWEPYMCATSDEKTQTFICTHLAGLTSWLPIQAFPDATPVVFYQGAAGAICRAPMQRPVVVDFSVLTIVEGMVVGIHPGDPLPSNRKTEYPLEVPLMVRDAERLGASWVLCVS